MRGKHGVRAGVDIGLFGGGLIGEEDVLRKLLWRGRGEEEGGGARRRWLLCGAGGGPVRVPL